MEPVDEKFWVWPLPGPFLVLRRSANGVGGHDFKTQWNQWMRCFEFGLSRSPFLVLRRSANGVGGHDFKTQWNQWMRCFGFGLSRSPFLVLRRSLQIQIRAKEIFVLTDEHRQAFQWTTL